MGIETDYYQILGVSRGASGEEMKAAWKDMAKRYHPDNNPDNPEAEEAFKKLGEAWEVLSDSEKRATYDRFGHNGCSDNRNTSARYRTRRQGISLEDLMKDLEKY